jgi:hypothetical protein
VAAHALDDRAVTPLRGSRLAAVALALLASLAILTAGDFLAHTDDGCAVEIHCLACQRVVGSIAIVAADIALAPALSLLGEVPIAASVIVPRAPAHRHSSRGPPPTA